MATPYMLKMTDGHDEKNYVKSSARYRNIMLQHALPKGGNEPRHIHYNKVLPSPFNRLGRPLNIMYIHHEMCPNIAKDGYRPSRPTPGIVVRRRGEALARLHSTAQALLKEHGKNLPAVRIDAEADRECLAGNHLTMALRMFDCNYTSPITGTRWEVKGDDELALVIKDGHRYIELDDNVSDDDCKFLSELLNSDQNQNQCHSEDHLRLHIKHVLDSYITPEKPMVPVSMIITKVCEQSVVKLKADHVGDTARFVADFHASPYVEQLSRWYAKNINPRQITIAARWMADLSQKFGQTRPLCKLGVTLLHYRGYVSTPGVAPNPDISRTVDVPLLTSLSGMHCKSLDVCETIMADTRKEFQTYICEKLGEHTGMDLFLLFEEASMRLMCGKTLHMPELKHGVSGKWTREKQLELKKAWLNTIATSTHPELASMLGDFGVDTTAALEVLGLLKNCCIVRIPHVMVHEIRGTTCGNHRLIANFSQCCRQISTSTCMQTYAYHVCTSACPYG